MIYMRNKNILKYTQQIKLLQEKIFSEVDSCIHQWVHHSYISFDGGYSGTIGYREKLICEECGKVDFRSKYTR